MKKIIEGVIGTNVYSSTLRQEFIVKKNDLELIISLPELAHLLTENKIELENNVVTEQKPNEPTNVNAKRKKDANKS
jgi:hypothetical protein